MKKILEYIIIFISLVIILFMALVATAKIPRSAIEDNLKESIEFYKKHQGIYVIKKKAYYSYIHYFADTRKLNIIYCIDTEKPIESVLWSKFYQTIKRDTHADFIDLVKESKEPNTQYLRYWNGCMIFLRPMLTVFNMEQIYLINQIVVLALGVILLVILFKKSKKVALIFLASLILVSIWYAAMCIEYSAIFYIIFITSIIAIRIDDNKKNDTKDNVNRKLSRLFFITGIFTTFFDFLTTEILSLFIPLMLVLMIRKEENRIDDLKETFKLIIKWSILWLISYAAMWLAKWILASVVLHINAFEYVKDEFVQRVNGLQGLNNHKELYKHVIDRNLFSIPLIYFVSENFFRFEVKIAIILAVFFVLIFIDWKNLKNKSFLLIMILIGIMPYIRYLILANHSYRHIMFTFRDQIITIMALLYAIIECLNYKLLTKKISIPIIKKKLQLKKEDENDFSNNSGIQ